MIFKPSKPDKKIVQLAYKISHYAHMPWVMPFFFIIFFLDSFLVFIPADTLLAVSILFAKDKKRAWFLVALAGALTGYLFFLFLTLSNLEEWAISFITTHDYNNYFQHIITHASKYGYVDLCLAVFTVVPSVICLVGGIIIGLNPAIVFFIVCLSKAFRIWLIIFLINRLYAAVILISHKIHDKKIEKHPH